MAQRVQTYMAFDEAGGSPLVMTGHHQRQEEGRRRRARRRFRGRRRGRRTGTRASFLVDDACRAHGVVHEPWGRLRRWWLAFRRLLCRRAKGARSRRLRHTRHMLAQKTWVDDLLLGSHS